MSDQTSTSDVPSSEKPLTCTSDKLPELAKELPVESIVTLEEDGSRRILLLDKDNEPYWRPYGGETLEEIRTFHRWEIAAQHKLHDERRTQEEMDTIRNVLMSLGVLKNFIDLEDELSDFMLASIQEKIALMLYRNDKKDQTASLTDDGDSKTYLCLAHYLIVNFYVAWNAVSASVEKCNQEIQENKEN